MTRVPIRLLQTASGDAYRAMMDATDAIHRDLCARHDIELVRFIGVKRGSYDWQATFNRIDLLVDMLDEGYDGWVLYIDADALVRQPAFPIRDYLDRRSGDALIAVSGTGQGTWDINAGVFFINFADPRTAGIIRHWHESFYRIVSDEMLETTPKPWGDLPDGNPFPDDQHLLQMVLLHHPDLLAGLHMETADFMNYGHGSFIRQVIREAGEDRVGQLEKMVADARAEAANPPSLVALADRHGTEKGMKAGSGHGYAAAYELFLGARRLRRFTLLEIGLSAGGPEVPPEHRHKPRSMPSIPMWLDYFPNADVIGVDVRDHRHLGQRRFRFEQVDMTKPGAVTGLAKRMPPLGLVVDDGSHASVQQQIGLVAFFRRLEAGGYYAIENLHWQPPEIEPTSPGVPTTAALLERFVETGRLESPAANEKSWASVADRIADVHFLRGEGGIIKAAFLRRKG